MTSDHRQAARLISIVGPQATHAMVALFAFLHRTAIGVPDIFDVRDCACGLRSNLPIRVIAGTWLFVCVLFVPTAEGTERLGDATYAYELGQCAGVVTAIEMDYLSAIESVSVKERFRLYRDYNQLMGTWLQVDFLQTLLDLAIAATSEADEDRARSMLRDHAQYILWELDNAIAELEVSPPDAQGLPPSRANERARSLLSSVRFTVDRLLVDHCATAPCIIGP